MATPGRPDAATAAAAVDFFVSYTSADEAWATWVAEVLEEAGASVRIQVWDSPAGENFVTWISQQMASSGRTVAICSPAYFDSHWCTQEWTGALAGRKLVPLRVAACALPNVLATISYRDLYGVDESVARRRALEAVGLALPVRKSSGFPQSSDAAAPFPGVLPWVWNVPGRNRHFTGRGELLDKVRDGLAHGPVAVTALHGLGGVGKTQLAIEYAHRRAADYELVWWVDSEQTALVGEKLAALARPLGLPTNNSVPDLAAAVLDSLAHRDRWLIVFDNAESPAMLRQWLPSGPGHVLITSRNHAWDAVAEAVEVDVLSRDESITLLRRRMPDMELSLAAEIAEELGDLPLALAQAAGYLVQTRTSPANYLRAFRARRAAYLARGEDPLYVGRIATTWSMALERLKNNAPATAHLLQMCALLAPEPIPLSLFPETIIPDIDDVVAAALGYALARRWDDSMQVHRLVQAVIASQIPDDQRNSLAETVCELIASAYPGDPGNPTNWPAWTALGIHIVYAASHLLIGDTDPHMLWHKAGMFCYHLYSRGDYAAARAVAADLHRHWASCLGDDHPITLKSAQTLAWTLSGVGDYETARRINEDTLARHQRLFGPDHPHTLTSAYNLSSDLADLGQFQIARNLAADGLDRRSRILGQDDPATLRSAHLLASVSADLGDLSTARELGEDTFARRQRVLGRNHADTLRSGASLVNVLADLGELSTARATGEDILSRLREALGPTHPDTLAAAGNLANVLANLGEASEARTLNEDILVGFREALGPAHPDTLAAAHNLAIDLAAVGEIQAAQQMIAAALDQGMAPADHVGTPDGLAELIGAGRRQWRRR
jgi:hypothetical protein